MEREDSTETTSPTEKLIVSDENKDFRLEDDTWILDLQSAFMYNEKPTASDIFAICKGRQIPECLRDEAWLLCLDVAHRSNQLIRFDNIFDLPEQNVIREDCQQLVAKLGNDGKIKKKDFIKKMSEIESIITFYCKNRRKQYERGNGWLELLHPLIALKVPIAKTYNLFEAIRDTYIPTGNAYSSELRLLLQYHDPELCSFLDTKRAYTDLYTKRWINTLFAGVCSLPAVSAMWDYYFMQADPFFMMFLSLIVLINSRHQILAMKDEDKERIIEFVSSLPCALEVDDVLDFCSLAKYYEMKTPSSFKQDLYSTMFGEGEDDTSITNALCLLISAQELVENSFQMPMTSDQQIESFRFFLVDCRPAEQYNVGHLPTAFHLDCNLMLQDRRAFETAVQGLLQAQRQALEVGSQAGGEHLCFLGSGRQEEDQYTLMVVASFLQKHTAHVSMVNNGYKAIHEYFGDELVINLVDHNSQNCLVCNDEREKARLKAAEPWMIRTLESDETDDTDETVETKSNNSDILSKIGLAMKLKSQEVKGKLFDYIVNPLATTNQNSKKKNSEGSEHQKVQRFGPVFSIDDDHDDMTVTSHTSEEPIELVCIEDCLADRNLIQSFQCKEVKINGRMYDSHLLVTRTHLIVLREILEQPGTAHVMVKRPLKSIVVITSRKKQPNLITFKYGKIKDTNETIITDMDRFLIPKATKAAKLVSKQILEYTEPEEPEESKE